MYRNALSLACLVSTFSPHFATEDCPSLFTKTHATTYPYPTTEAASKPDVDHIALLPTGNRLPLSSEFLCEKISKDARPFLTQTEHQGFDTFLEAFLTSRPAAELGSMPWHLRAEAYVHRYRSLNKYLENLRPLAGKLNLIRQLAAGGSLEHKKPASSVGIEIAFGLGVTGSFGLGFGVQEGEAFASGPCLVFGCSGGFGIGGGVGLVRWEENMKTHSDACSSHNLLNNRSSIGTAAVGVGITIVNETSQSKEFAKRGAYIGALYHSNNWEALVHAPLLPKFKFFNKRWRILQELNTLEPLLIASLRALDFTQAFLPRVNCQ